MKKKYIIDLNPDCVEGDYLRIPARIAGEEQWLVTKAALTPYTEPDLEQVRKEAYDKGYDDAAEKKYNDGLADAWEAARKIVLGDINIIASVFGTASRSIIIRDLTPAEVIEKLKAYKQKRDAEIKVGDEVELKCGVRPAIYMQGAKGSDEIYLLFNDGSCGLHSKSEIVRKTGRHFPEIATILENMRGEQDG